MPGLFSSPKVPSAPAPPNPPTNTAVTAQLAQIAKRQGQNASVLTGPRGVTQRGQVGGHTLTGQ